MNHYFDKITLGAVTPAPNLLNNLHPCTKHALGFPDKSVICRREEQTPIQLLSRNAAHLTVSTMALNLHSVK